MARYRGTLTTVLTGLCFATQVAARTPTGRGSTEVLSLSSIVSGARCSPAHSRGRLMLRVDNAFYLGESINDPVPDCLDQSNYYRNGMEFPRGSNVNFGLGIHLMAGGVIDGDTLVTVAGETRPEPGTGEFEFRSTRSQSDEVARGALAEVEWLARGTDTDWVGIPISPILPERHKPLGIELTTHSLSWTYAYATDMVLFDMRLKNIGKERIRDVYIGLGTAPSVGFTGSDELAYGDLTGFVRTFPEPDRCVFSDTINTMWWADNDGDPIDGAFQQSPVPGPGGDLVRSAPDVMGICLLYPAARPGARQGSAPQQCFNWWWQNPFTLDTWGPVTRENVAAGGSARIGAPDNDREAYFLLRNGEIDFDQAFTASIPSVDPVWTHPPAALSADIADGSAEIEAVLSFGPVDLAPGAEYAFGFAVLAGEHLHTDPDNLNKLPNNPNEFYRHLDFSNLAKNAVWAQKIYDNPGYDTDGDGYAGEFRVCHYDSIYADGVWQYTRADTEWYRGDGIPDWRAAGPPPPPDFWLSAVHEGIHVRFNGQVTETAKDVLTQQVDFEGYRIYLGRDEREASYSTIASYDLDDYDKWVFNPDLATGPAYELRGEPLTIERLRCLYGSGTDPCDDSIFNPLRFSRTRPYVLPGFSDSVFYFEKHGFNVSAPGVTTPITRIYPDVPDPRLLPPDSITPDMYTEDGYLKYYEYEFTIENLLPTVPYWVNVTAFDFGSPESGLEPLESSVTLNARSAYPLHDMDQSVSGSHKVYVYPNPYRIDEDYRGLGFEGRTMQDRSDDRVRAIWFANLPPKCTITVFTLDGDRVRTLEHSFAPGDPTGTHHRWDLINRNMQRVVSGLYYWTVETPDRETQMGKLVIIR